MNDMRSVQVQSRTFELIQKLAAPYESKDAVIARALLALEAAEKQRPAPFRSEPPRRVQPAPGPRPVKPLPKAAFREPLLDCLLEAGGKASAKEVKRRLEQKLATRLGPADRQLLRKKDPRWWKNVGFVRLELIREKLIRDDSPRGLWELSGAGWAGRNPR